MGLPNIERIGETVSFADCAATDQNAKASLNGLNYGELE
jgi:hypothetical protein